jgi:hypothetical protein
MLGILRIIEKFYAGFYEFKNSQILLDKMSYRFLVTIKLLFSVLSNNLFAVDDFPAKIHI